MTESFTEKECAICLDMIKKKSDMDKLPCGHYFHISCMLNCHNSIKNQQCPYCRNKLYINNSDGVKLFDKSKTITNNDEKNKVKSDFTEIDYDDIEASKILYLEIYSKMYLNYEYDKYDAELLDILTCNYKLIKEQLKISTPSVLIKYYNTHINKYSVRCLYKINIGNCIDTTNKIVFFNMKKNCYVVSPMYDKYEKNESILITSVLRSLLMFNNIGNIPVTFKKYYDGNNLIEYFDVNYDISKYSPIKFYSTNDNYSGSGIIATDSQSRLTLKSLIFLDIEPIIIKYFIENSLIDKLLNTNMLSILYDLLLKVILSKSDNYLKDFYLVDVYKKLITIFDLYDICYSKDNLDRLFEYGTSSESIDNLKLYINNNNINDIIEQEKLQMNTKRRNSFIFKNDKMIKLYYRNYYYDVFINI